jgi:hypothetical protein
MRHLADAPHMQEPIFWTPTAIQDLAKNLHTAMLVFNDDVSRVKDAGQLPPGELEAWRMFRDGWSKWYGATTASTWLWSATVSTIEGYATQLTAWRAKYASWTGKLPTGTDATGIAPYQVRVDTSGEQKLVTTDTDWSGLYWGLGVVVLLGGGYWYWLNKEKVHAVGRKAQGYGQKATKYAPANWRSRKEAEYVSAQNQNKTVMAGLKRARKGLGAVRTMDLDKTYFQKDLRGHLMATFVPTERLKNGNWRGKLLRAGSKKAVTETVRPTELFLWDDHG